MLLLILSMTGSEVTMASDLIADTYFYQNVSRIDETTVLDAEQFTLLILRHLNHNP